MNMNGKLKKFRPRDFVIAPDNYNFGDFVDVLSLHIGFRNPLSVKFGGGLVVILFSYVSRVLGSFLHLIQFLCISLFVFYVFDSVLLDGLSDFVLLFLYFPT